MESTCYVAKELSFAEELLWQADQAGPAALPLVDCAPSFPIVVRLEHTLDLEALSASLNEIVRRHDALRSRFPARNGRPERLLEDSLTACPVSINCRGMRGEHQSEALRHLIAHHVNRRFDLTSGPLFRAILVALADDEHILAFTVHHIIFDRWSKRVLATELKEFYEAYITGRTPNIRQPVASYQDYVQWQKQRLNSRLGRDLVQHWTGRLRGLSALVLPCDGSRKCASTRSGTLCFTILSEDADRLMAMSRRYRVTLATLMLAILKLFLNKIGNNQDIAVGVPLSDRRRPEFEHVIGLFMNVVVVRTRVTDKITFLELLDRVRRNLVDACLNQDVPYGYLAQAIGGQTPLYRVVFNFLTNIPGSQLELVGLQVTPLEVSANLQSLADLSLNIRFNAGALACRLVYKADLFSSTRVQAFVAQFQTLVSAILTAPQKSVCEYDLMDCQSSRDSPGQPAATDLL